MTTADALYTLPGEDGPLVVTSAGGDFTIRIWEVDEGMVTDKLIVKNIKVHFKTY